MNLWVCRENCKIRENMCQTRALYKLWALSMMVFHYEEALYQVHVLLCTFTENYRYRKLTENSVIIKVNGLMLG